jgi:hypothetical protein
MKPKYWELANETRKLFTLVNERYLAQTFTVKTEVDIFR